jgi:hypothetical protein
MRERGREREGGGIGLKALDAILLLSAADEALLIIYSYVDY